MSESDSKKLKNQPFTRREWLMVIGIIVLTEAAILISSFAVMSDVEVINFFSFASAIASLILAVLAIVYGFYQSEAQKRTGDGVELHLSKLSGAADRLSHVSSALSGNAEKIAGVTDALENLGGAINATHHKISTLEGGINSVTEGYADVAAKISLFVGKNSSSTSGAVSEGIAEARSWLLGSQRILIQIFAYSIYLVFKKNPSGICDSEVFGAATSRAVVGSGRFNINSDQADGAIAAALMFFALFGVLNTIGKEQEAIGLVEGSMDQLEKMAEKFKEQYKADLLFEKIEEELSSVNPRPNSPSTA